ncbi:MAG: glutamate-1-semialdehyde 2,1-aminomutase [Planctomycetes bacterium]|nr:glutamate-1-semialdehyde 2,1-aminomutase [Planctomycetota bacterium]
MDAAADRNAALFDRARRVLPGGVNSPVRAFGAVGGTPVFVRSAKGCRLLGEDGRTYLDMVGSWGPLLLGHAHPRIVKAIREAAGDGTSFGMPSAVEVEMAEAVARAMPSLEMVRFTCSGTEAAMSAVRLARAATGRDLVLKFAGGYHGHADGFLVEAGSGAATGGVPSSPGVPASVAGATLTARYNDLADVERLLRAHAGRVACVAVEPVAGNMGVVPPEPGFLEGLRGLCDGHGALLLFDEVISGFRAGPGGAQGLYGVRPDLTALGKIIGGGLPVGAYGGRRVLMERVAPSGPVYQAGTLSGNPLAMRAGLEMLRILAEQPQVFARLESLGADLEAGLRDAAAPFADRTCVQRVGSLLTLFFCPGPVRNFEDALRADRAAFGRFFHGMLRRGVHLPPAQFEAWFLSAAHGDEEIGQAVAAAREALPEALGVRP